jgi:Zn-dependent protease
MAWSFPVARIAGTQIWVHVTFILLLAWAALALLPTGGLAGLGLVPLLLVCVILHECGHAAMAARFGMHPHDIILLPTGDMAGRDALPARPGQEIAIALAGPMVSLALGLLFIAPGTGGMLARIGWINLALAGFNLIPALPMDGGRVLRVLLGHRLGQARATRLAAGAGQVVAVGFSLLGLFAGSPALVLVGLFLFMAADETRPA